MVIDINGGIFAFLAVFKHVDIYPHSKSGGNFKNVDVNVKTGSLK